MVFLEVREIETFSFMYTICGDNNVAQRIIPSIVIGLNISKAEKKNIDFDRAVLRRISLAKFPPRSSITNVFICNSF